MMIRHQINNSQDANVDEKENHPPQELGITMLPTSAMTTMSVGGIIRVHHLPPELPAVAVVTVMHWMQN